MELFRLGRKWQARIQKLFSQGREKRGNPQDNVLPKVAGTSVSNAGFRRRPMPAGLNCANDFGIVWKMSCICLAGNLPVESSTCVGQDYGIQHFVAVAHAKKWRITQETNESPARQPAQQLQ
jgi:hypothetical protein